MEQQELSQGIQQARQSAKKRKFSQTVDLIINLKALDLKKEGDRINTYLTLPHQKGKKIKVTALVGKELAVKAKETCHHTVTDDQFKSMDKKKVKKLAADSDFFIAQANIMPKVASAFGKVLGPKGLMPNPKAGCVVPPTAELKPVVERLQKTVHLQTKNETAIKAPLGKEDMKDEELVANGMAIINALLPLFPQEKANIKNIMVKLTMGKPITIGAKPETKKEKQKPEVKEEKKEKPKPIPKKKEAKKETKK
jgi:large subunit ribosomal protein L1